MQNFVFSKKFPASLKIDLIKVNGDTCQLCSKKIINLGTMKLNNFYNKFEVHHIKFKAFGGQGIKSNALVCCKYCHKSLHIFMDIFRPLLSKDYLFLTTVYVHLFLSPQKDKRIYNNFPLKRFANSLTSLARKFRSKVNILPKVNYMLLQYYMYKCNKYYVTEVSFFISKSISYKKLLYQVEKNIDLINGLLYHKDYKNLFSDVMKEAA